MNKPLTVTLLVIICLALIFSSLNLVLPTNKTGTANGKANLWKPIIDVNPSTVLAGSIVTISVDLVYQGFNALNADPFELRSLYHVNLSIYYYGNRTLYASKFILHNTTSQEKPILFNEGSELTLAWMNLFFTKPGKYIINATVEGPNLTQPLVSRLIEVKGGRINLTNSVATQSGDWIMELHVSPVYGSLNKSASVIINITVKYIGTKNYTVTGGLPLISQVTLIHSRGLDEWSLSFPKHVSNLPIKPGFTRTYTISIGPYSDYKHEFTPGLYKVIVTSSVYTETGQMSKLTASTYFTIRS